MGQVPRTPGIRQNCPILVDNKTHPWNIKTLINEKITDNFQFTYYNHDDDIWFDKIFCLKCKRIAAWEFTSMLGHRIWCGQCSAVLSQDRIEHVKKLLKVGMVLKKYEL
jgi:hypothetical protein